jgi:putative hydrolase of HD superfamily
VEIVYCTKIFYTAKSVDYRHLEFTAPGPFVQSKQQIVDRQQASQQEFSMACIHDPSSLPSDSYLTFILDVCGVLKRLKRQGWILRKVPFPESDSDHMHRVAICSMLYHNTNSPQFIGEDEYNDCLELHPSRIDAQKLLRMALTHDLCEAIAGDVTPHCANAPDRERLEEQAMQHIQRIVGGTLGKELAELWKEYEEQLTPTAIIVKDIDKFEMLAQAYEYEQEHLKSRDGANQRPQDKPNTIERQPQPTHDPPSVREEPLRDFFQSQQGKMITPLFQKLDAELRHRRGKMLMERGWILTEGEK